MDKAVITLGGGCFWCMEAIFGEVKGVLDVESGYAGGTTPKPSYKQVCTGRTGHAEVVRVTYDPRVVSLENLLEIFFAVHDPTTVNRQGADVGTQYRSIVLYRTQEEKRTVQAVIERVTRNRVYASPIVTEVVPLRDFTKAELSHQDYYRVNPSAPYCQLVIAPKLEKFRKLFKDKTSPP